jgi:hypothetical protein
MHENVSLTLTLAVIDLIILLIYMHDFSIMNGLIAVFMNCMIYLIMPDMLIIMLIVVIMLSLSFKHDTEKRFRTEVLTWTK